MGANCPCSPTDQIPQPLTESKIRHSVILNDLNDENGEFRLNDEASSSSSSSSAEEEAREEEQPHEEDTKEERAEEGALNEDEPPKEEEAPKEDEAPKEEEAKEEKSAAVEYKVDIEVGSFLFMHGLIYSVKRKTDTSAVCVQSADLMNDEFPKEINLSGKQLQHVVLLSKEDYDKKVFCAQTEPNPDAAQTNDVALELTQSIVINASSAKDGSLSQDMISDDAQSRLIEVMRQYQKQFVDETRSNIANIPRFFQRISKSYGLVQFLDDFHQYLDKENSDTTHTENVYNLLLKEANDDQPCILTKCQSISRHHNRSILYEDNRLTAEEIAYCQLCDTVHEHLFHSFDTGRRLLTKDKPDTNTNETDESEIVSSSETAKYTESIARYREFRDIVQIKNDHSKFMTTRTTDDKSFCDELITNFRWKYKASAVTLYKYLHDEEYDSEAIIDDVDIKSDAIDNDLQSNIKMHLNSEDMFTNVRDFCLVNSQTVYAYGYRYYYWDTFRGNANQTMVIYRDEITVADPGNKGYSYHDWCIDKKYATLKEEIVDNAICCTEINLWNIWNFKAGELMKCEICKQLKANPFWENAYGIKHETPVTKDHILSLLFYCDFTNLCRVFSETYRKKSKYETNASLKERHSHFYNMGKLLRELIEVYGNRFSRTEDKYFYHGIDQSMIFKSCHAKIYGPMSTTVEEQVAINFTQGTGIVLKLQNDQSLAFFMDCSKFSGFSNESERLFIGGFAAIPFVDIFDMSNNTSYENWVRALDALCSMISQPPEALMCPFEQKYVRAVIKEHNNVPHYIQMLYKHFCSNVEYVMFDMDLMERNKFMNTTRWLWNYGFKPLFDIFFSQESNIVKLSLIFNLFSNVKEIRIKRWKIKQYQHKINEIKPLLHNLLSTLHELTSKRSKLRKFVIMIEDDENDKKQTMSNIAKIIQECNEEYFALSGAASWKIDYRIEKDKKEQAIDAICFEK